MRTRLIVVFLIPLLGVLLTLGVAYAASAARSIQQDFYAAQLADLGYFVTSARQALITGNTTVIEGEAERYRQLYGSRVMVIDRSGTTLGTGPLDPVLQDQATISQIRLALSGRRGELPQATLPWSLGDAVIVEPVFEDDDVIGALVIATSTDAPRQEILQSWGILAVILLMATALSVFVVFRIAHWVLGPVRRVDRAMAAIERGDMEARIADDTGPPELRRMIQVFNRMAGEIERVLARQKAFALNASHELRNPLNALLVRVEYLATGLGEEWEGDIEETREEGRRMVRILDTLLSLARSGRGDAPLIEVDIAGLAQSRVEAWRDVAGRKEIGFDVSGDYFAPALTDRTIVESALDAVIDNAVKFSPPGTSIEVTTSRGSEGCRIVVRDHGPGLSESEVEHAVERFWRGSGTQNIPGSGLGLAIATDLLATVGGALTVAAPEGGGLAVALQLTGGARP